MSHFFQKIGLKYVCFWYYLQRNISMFFLWQMHTFIFQHLICLDQFYARFFRFYNFIYKIQGKDYVGNLSPMHEPYHLFEFSKKAFEIHSKNSNYDIVDYKYYVCQTFLPKIFEQACRFSNVSRYCWFNGFI